MGIYSRKRKKSGFRVFILSLFVLSTFLVLGYYFFYPNNLKTVLDENLSDKIVETKNEVELKKVSETNEDEYFQSEIHKEMQAAINGKKEHSIVDKLRLINITQKIQRLSNEAQTTLNNLEDNFLTFID